MIYHVNGTLELCEPSSCVVDCSGVGYKLTISDNTYSEIVGHTGEKLKLLTYLQVREDGVELFGFRTNDELSSFKLLIGVSGVGPKAAMAILSLLTPEKLQNAICAEDVKTISRASGVGAKTAARVVLELKDKISKQLFAKGGSTQGVGQSVGAVVGKGNLAEAMEALVTLGYSRSEAQSALSGIDPKTDVEKIIPLALAKLMR